MEEVEPGKRFVVSVDRLIQVYQKFHFSFCLVGGLSFTTEDIGTTLLAVSVPVVIMIFFGITRVSLNYYILYIPTLPTS